MIKQVVVDTTGGKVIGPAIPIEVMTAAQAAGLPVEAKLQRVVQVTDADVTSGRAKVVGGRPQPVVLGTGGTDVSSGPVLQVYVVAGSLGGGSGNVPFNTALPVISGTLAVGQVLTTTDGTWMGTAPISYTYQWKRNGVAIGAATANTYTITVSDPGSTITVVVTATNVAGNTSATSAGVTPSALLNGVSGYWKVEEASGTRVDATGRGNDCNVLNGAPGNAAGKIGNALQCVAASTQYVERASNSDLQTGDIDFSAWAWVNLASKGANRGILGKSSTAAIEYAVRYTAANDRFTVFVSSNGTGFTNSVDANNFGSPPLSTWCFVFVWHDSVANTLNIQVNDGVVNSGAYSAGLIAGAGAFRIGSVGAVSWQWDGLIDEVCFSKRVYTAAERTSFYNGGNGISYPF